MTRHARERVIELPETALIAAGAFIMGDDAGRPDERPAHTVHVSAFRIALTPVTNAQYRRFLDASGHEPPRFWSDDRFNTSDQPVVSVTWFDSVAYCKCLSLSSGELWRLPTEAEREKAARGGGSDDDDIGLGGDRFMQEAPFAVGRSTANGYGLFDMTYNVHEWCRDWYEARYYETSPPSDPTGPGTGTRRASRGGAWRHQVKLNRCSARSSLDPAFQYNDYGFRVVCEIE